MDTPIENDKRIVFLLTASIDPKGMQYVARTNLKQREQDYISVLQYLISSTSYPIVFCENNLGYDLSAIRSVLQTRGEGRWEILQFAGQDFPREKGKGYGEMLIMEHALTHSTLLTGALYVVKITGRYQLKNSTEVLQPLTVRSDISALADFTPEARFAYSGVFAGTPDFITQYLFPFKEYVDDSKGNTMEIALQKALTKASSDGKSIVSFPATPIIEGISGTWNVPIDARNPNQIVFSLPKLRIILRGYMLGLRRRIKSFCPVGTKR